MENWLVQNDFNIIYGELNEISEKLGKLSNDLNVFKNMATDESLKQIERYLSVAQHIDNDQIKTFQDLVNEIQNMQDGIKEFFQEIQAHAANNHFLATGVRLTPPGAA